MASPETTEEWKKWSMKRIADFPEAFKFQSRNKEKAKQNCKCGEKITLKEADQRLWIAMIAIEKENILLVSNY